ncbi:hypothetical protein Tco_0674073 [Tanacetum coccineum]
MEQVGKQQEPKYTIVSSDVDHKALSHALMESILEDEDAMDKGVADKLKKRKPDDDRDEDPPAGPDQRLKRKETGKETEPSKKAKSTGTSKGTTKSQPKSIGKSAQADETVFEAGDTQISDLTQDILVGPAYKLLKGTRRSYVELDYNMEECYKALTDQLDWNNPEEESTGRTYMTSLTKTKAVKYDLKGIEDMVPNLWSPIKVAYDKHALLGDFPQLYLIDIKDMLLLVKRVEDLQLGVESYQKKLNISKPRICEEDLSRRASYTTLSDPQGVIYEDKLNKKRLMHSDERYKFSDGTLQSVRDTLHDMATNLRMGYNNAMPRRRWSSVDKT